MKPRSSAALRIVPAIIALGTGTALAQTTVDTATNPVYTAGNILSHTWTGAGTLTFQGPGTIGLDDSGGGNRNYFNMTGGLIQLTGGVTLKNGGWQGGDWTNNQASMNIGPASTLDLWDGFPVRVDALAGGGNVSVLTPWNAGTKDLVVGVNNGSGTFGGRLYNGNSSVKLTKEGSGTQVLAGIGEHSGGNYVSDGTLAGANPAAFGSGPIILQGGNVEFRPQRGLTLTELGGSLNKDPYSPSSTVDSGFFSVHSTTAGASFPDNTTRAYAGQIYLTAGNWSFAENFDDGVFLKIGSTTLLDNNSWNEVTNGTINIGTSGWFDIDLRVGQGVGGVGPAGGDNWTRGIGVGMVNTSTTSTNANDYQSFGLGVLGSNLRPGTNDTNPYAVSNNIAVNQAGSLSVTESGLTVTASGSLSGSGALTTSGPGTLVLAGDNAAFGGNIVINGGTLAAVGGNSNFGQNSASRTITVNNGGTLDFRRGDVFGGHQTTTIPDIIINAGGTVTNKAGANVNPLNNVILNGGTLTAEAGFGAVGLRAWSLNGNITSTGASIISDNPDDPNSGINMETNPTIDVQSGTLHLSARLADKAFDNGASGITKQGSGTLVLAGTSTYTGATNVDAGTLLVTGQLGATHVSVGGGALFAGGGTLGGTLHFASGAGLVFSLTDTLTVNGSSVSFAGFSIANLFGFGNEVPVGTYFLLDGDATVNTANLGNLGAGNAFIMGDTGKQAYFETGSLNLVVVPEPRAALLGGLGLLALLRRRRG